MYKDQVLEYFQLRQDFLATDFSRREGCSAEQYNYFDCCDFHRDAAEREFELKRRGWELTKLIISGAELIQEYTQKELSVEPESKKDELLLRYLASPNWFRVPWCKAPLSVGSPFWVRLVVELSECHHELSRFPLVQSEVGQCSCSSVKQYLAEYGTRVDAPSLLVA